jgi:hypothetical protein
MSACSLCSANIIESEYTPSLLRVLIEDITLDGTVYPNHFGVQM